MSGAEADLAREEVILPPEQEEREKKKVRNLISQALLNASVPLEGRKLQKYLLPGLWHCAMAVLFSLLEPDEIVELLDAQHSLIKGASDNANVPPKRMSEKALETYTKNTTSAAEAIMGQLMEAYDRAEELEIETWFPSLVLNSVVTVLLPAWGAEHVRRAIVEQSAWLIQKRIAIRNFIEPDRYATIPKKIETTDIRETVKIANEAHTKAIKRSAVERHVSCFVATNTFDGGRSAWVIVMRIKFENGRFENRELMESLVTRPGIKPGFILFMNWFWRFLRMKAKPMSI